MQLPEKRQPNPDQAWLAYGPAKQRWKATGKYYTTDELRRLEESLRDLRIRPARSSRIHVN
ncbi:MAG: hypothetical protein HY735_32360 [Verrucomicrobia bacterium]|nr:hypothetical protein [Verrucomicrobiota bacterium]